MRNSLTSVIIPDSDNHVLEPYAVPGGYGGRVGKGDDGSGYNDGSADSGGTHEFVGARAESSIRQVLIFGMELLGMGMGITTHYGIAGVQCVQKCASFDDQRGAIRGDGSGGVGINGIYSGRAVCECW